MDAIFIPRTVALAVLVTEAEEACSTGHPNQRKAMANWNTLVKHIAGPPQQG